MKRQPFPAYVLAMLLATGSTVRAIPIVTAERPAFDQLRLETGPPSGPPPPQSGMAKAGAAIHAAANQAPVDLSANPFAAINIALTSHLAAHLAGFGLDRLAMVGAYGIVEQLDPMRTRSVDAGINNLIGLGGTGRNQRADAAGDSVFVVSSVSVTLTDGTPSRPSSASSGYLFQPSAAGAASSPALARTARDLSRYRPQPALYGTASAEGDPARASFVHGTSLTADDANAAAPADATSAGNSRRQPGFSVFTERHPGPGPAEMLRRSYIARMAADGPPGASEQTPEAFMIGPSGQATANGRVILPLSVVVTAGLLCSSLTNFVDPAAGNSDSFP